MTPRVLLLHRDLPHHGGVANSYLTLARYRDPSALDIVFGSFRPPSPEFRQSLEAIGTPAITLSESYPVSLYRLRAEIRRRHIAAVVCGSFKSYVVAKGAIAGTGCRVIYRIPSIPFQTDLIRKHLFRLLARNDSLIFISQAVRDAHAYAWHRGPEYIIYNGIPDEGEPLDAGARERLLASLGIPPGAIVVGYVAELTDWKDHKTLIDAFGRLGPRYPALHLLLIGTGRLRPEIERIAAGTGLAGRIHLVGARTDVQRLLRVLDVYAHPAVGEAFGRAVGEAMLAERPIVAARAGALPELIQPRVSGLLFTPHDAGALSNAIGTLLDERGLADRLGRAARAYTLAQFSPERFVEGMTLAIQEGIGQAQIPGAARPVTTAAGMQVERRP